MSDFDNTDDGGTADDSVKQGRKSWIHSVCVRVLQSGPIPHHVAIIMDGNRRFAKKKNYDRAKGHLLGFEAFAQTMEWCLDLGVKEVTVYAFSIENFKRSKEEVDGLMELARQKITRILGEKEMLKKHSIHLRVLGDIRLLPMDIQESIAEAVELTKHNDKARLNICFAYTARDDMCHAIREIAEGVQLGLIRESDVSESLFERCLYSERSPPPDLLLRTSGEVRLSDFLLWQSSYSVLAFMKVLWPEFTQWDLYAGIIHYQRHHAAIEVARAENKKWLNKLQLESDIRCVEKEMSDAGMAVSPGSVSNERLAEYTAGRLARLDAFHAHLDRKNEDFMASILASRLQTMQLV